MYLEEEIPECHWDAAGHHAAGVARAVAAAARHAAARHAAAAVASGAFRLGHVVLAGKFKLLNLIALVLFHT